MLKNWKEFIEDWPNVPGIKDPNFVPYYRTEQKKVVDVLLGNDKVEMP